MPAAPAAPAIAAIDRAPEDRLPAEPVCGSLSDVARAGRELAWLDSREETIDAAHSQKLALLAQQTERAKQLEVDGQAMTFAARRAALETAAAKWCHKHRRTILEGDTKSRELTHCVVGWSSSPLGVGYAEGCDAKTAAKKLDKLVDAKSGLRGFLSRALAKFQVGSAGVAELVSIKVSISVSQALAALKAGKVTSKDLKKLDLVEVPPADHFFLKPKPYSVPSIEG